MLVEGLEKIQLGIFFDLNAQVIKLLNRCVTCQEVKGSGTKGNNLQIRQTNNCPGDRHKLVNHVSAFLGSTNGILRNICLDIAQL